MIPPAPLTRIVSAVDSQPAFRLARFNLGRMLIAQRRDDEAIVELEKLTGAARRRSAAISVRARHRARACRATGTKGSSGRPTPRQLAREHGQHELAAAIERDLASLK